MIVNDITYAIVGEQTPVSGIKVDISKPEATVSGVFRTKKDWVPWALFGFEFKGGITDRNFSFLKANGDFNTAFEVRPSFHVIPPWNGGKYGSCPDAGAKAALVNASNDKAEAHRAAVRDSFYAVALIRRHHMVPLTDWDDEVTLPATTSDAEKRILIYFIETFQGKPGLGLTTNNTLDQILAKMPALGTTSSVADMTKYNDKVFQAYEKYKKADKEADEALVNTMITNAAHIWTRKDYWWFTFTPYAKTEKVNQYYTKYEGKDSLHFKSDYQFYYGANLYINYYMVLPQKVATLVRFGASAMYSNNLTTLSAFNYETRTPFFVQGQATTEETKAGSAYKNNELKNAWVGQTSLECYLLPLNTLVPGLYLSSGLNVSNLYKLSKITGRDEDMTQVSFEGGAVFNVNSREKDKEKSIFSLLFYIRHEDLTDTRRTAITTGIEETRDEFRKRNMSIGVRVGIPINLPHRP